MSIKSLFSLFVLTIVTTGCYRIPGDNDYSVIPTTNNRALTKEKPSLVPGVKY